MNTETKPIDPIERAAYDSAYELFGKVDELRNKLHEVKFAQHNRMALSANHAIGMLSFALKRYVKHTNSTMFDTGVYNTLMRAMAWLDFSQAIELDMCRPFQGSGTRITRQFNKLYDLYISSGSQDDFTAWLDESHPGWNCQILNLTEDETA
jgi:hypothetical protein